MVAWVDDGSVGTVQGARTRGTIFDVGSAECRHCTVMCSDKIVPLYVSSTSNSLVQRQDKTRQPTQGAECLHRRLGGRPFHYVSHLIPLNHH
jgi:hypothetical protein